ncbi:hypothetical protein AB0903_29875, partial [Streptomyces sp. NPDC048389]
MTAVVVLVIILVVALFAGVHWYVWRRLVRDTTARGGTARRVGTAAVWVLPLLSFAALVSGRAGAPFWLERILAWPGQLWLAVLLYLVMALLVGEAVRPLLRRALERRAAASGDHPNETAVPSARPTPGSAAAGPVLAGPAASPATAASGEAARPAGAPWLFWCVCTAMDPARSATSAAACCGVVTTRISAF